MKDETLYSLSRNIGPVLIAALARSLRIRIYGGEQLQKARRQGPVLFALFHGRMFIPVWIHRKDGITALVSESRDGEAVTQLVKAIGYDTIRGSSTRGGRVALKAMINRGRNGSDLAIMVDGPRGPLYEPKAGTLAIARSAGATIVPTLGTASAYWQLGSWDHFQVPKPFSRGVVGYGEPLFIPPDVRGDTLKEMGLELKRKLLRLMDEIDRFAREKR